MVCAVVWLAKSGGGVGVVGTGLCNGGEGRWRGTATHHEPVGRVGLDRKTGGREQREKEHRQDVLVDKVQGATLDGERDLELAEDLPVGQPRGDVELGVGGGELSAHPHAGPRARDPGRRLPPAINFGQKTSECTPISTDQRDVDHGTRH